METDFHRKVILIGGLPASGKTTLAVGLQNRLGSSAITIDGDAVWHHMLGTTPQLPGSEQPNFSISKALRWLATMVGKTTAATINHQTVIVAHPFEGVRQRRVFEYLPALLGADLHAFWLIAPTDIAAERASSRQAVQLSEKRDPHNYSLGNASKHDPHEFAQTISLKWTRLDASLPRDEILAQTLEYITVTGALSRKPALPNGQVGLHIH